MRLLALVLTLASTAMAHDLALRVEQAQPAVIVYATYGGSEPVTDADVSVFSPDNQQSPFQTGLTDVKGVFAFVPSESGEWLVVFDDGYGHRAERKIAVDFQGDGAASTGSERSTLDKAVLGVSMIFGLTGVFLWLQTRRRAEAS